MKDLASLRDQLLAADGGFSLLRGLYSPEEVIEYRNYCEEFVRSGTVIHDRIMRPNMADFVHPRSHDEQSRTVRIYQFLHNHQNDKVGQFLSRGMDLRNQIEESWLDDPVYRSEKQTLMEYNIVTQYYESTGMLTRHRDYCGPAPFPMLQTWVALSQPGKDYKQGYLVLFANDGTRISVENDLDIQVGDAVMFDKRLEHEVEPTQRGEPGGAGRWTVLIGARAPEDTPWAASKKRLLYGPPFYPVFRAASKALKSVGLR